LGSRSREFNQEFNQIIIELYKNSFKIITFTGDVNIIFREGDEKERERERERELRIFMRIFID